MTTLLMALTRGPAMTPTEGLILVIFGLLFFLLVKFCVRVRHFPQGPFPLPVVGNIFAMLRWPRPFYQMGQQLQNAYGDPHTIWFGWFPLVIVNDYDNFREASLGIKRSHFAGRLQLSIGTLQKSGYEDIVFGKYGPEWEALRKVAHLAVRKYAVSETLGNLVVEVLDDTLADQTASGKVIDMDEFILEAMHNIIGMCVFGQKYEKDSEDLKTIRRINSDLKEPLAKVLLADLMPPLRVFFRHHERRAAKLFDEFIALEMCLYQQARATFVEGQIRHFTDAIVAAKLEAEAADRRTAQYLTEGNLTQIVYDIFGAATPTTSLTLKWLLYFVFSDANVLSRCRNEIDEVVSDRQPSSQDRVRCPFVNAAILEVLRIRPVSPFSLPHETTCASTLGGRYVPKGAPVLFNLYSVNHNPALWELPDEFRPERFLGEEGELRRDLVSRMSTFGVGARACIGEKMATNIIFVMFARFLQMVQRLTPESGDFDLNPQLSPFNCGPRKHKCVLTMKKKADLP